jgi:hypothetical protein
MLTELAADVARVKRLTELASARVLTSTEVYVWRLRAGWSPPSRRTDARPANLLSRPPLWRA